MNNIKNYCNNYFQGFRDIYHHRSFRDTAIGTLKVVSYLTLVAPIIIGTTWAATTGISKLKKYKFRQTTTSSAKKPTSTVLQVKVLNQNFRASGFSECGYHALKNALIAIIPKDKRDDSLFNDETFFEKVFNFVGEGCDPTSPDAASSKLVEALTRLIKNNLDAIDSKLQHLAKHLKTTPHSISILDIFDGNLLTSSESSLSSIADLLEVKDRSGPFLHAFCVGLNDHSHWITILLERKADGTDNWYGMDSWNNQVNHLINSKICLKNLFTSINDNIESFYDNAVGDDIGRKASWFNDAFELIDTNDKNRFVGKPEDIEKYMKRIMLVHDFFNRTKWYNSNDDSKKQAVENYKKFAVGFAKLLENKDNKLEEILGSFPSRP